MAYGRTLTLLILAAFPAVAAQAQAGCADLAKTGSATVKITVATVVEDGSFTPESGGRTLDKLPAFCRVAATLNPTADSVIHTEVWLPVTGWNGKYMAVGSGGWGGSIGYAGMAEALRRGYAASATDDGHTGPSASFVVGHPEKLKDFAWRADHEMTVEAKRLVQTFYGRGPRYAYWNGCSGGGREGLIQAARFPDAFDGVIAGDPANIRRNAWALWLATHSFRDPADSIPPSKYAMIHRFVLNACDASDGLKDGLIGDPESCHPDFTQLACRAEDGAECLTARQVKTAQTILSPETAPDGSILFPRLEPGTELRWARTVGGPAPADLFYDEFRYVVYGDPAWNWRSFDEVKDPAKAHAIDKDVDEMDPHLQAFAQHGGKLLIYHGWADQQVAPGSSVDFYRAVAGLSGGEEKTAAWLRLYMLPGMGHCSGGEGPDSFDKISVMEQWVEHGKAPAEIVAAHKTEGKVDRTRPICPYP